VVAEMAGAATSVVEDAEWMIFRRGGSGEDLWTRDGVGERRNLAAQTGCQEDLESVGRLSCGSEWEQASV
jgi:hypothetical protein